MIESFKDIFYNFLSGLGYGNYGIDFAYGLYYCFGFIACCTIFFLPFAMIIKIIRGICS